MGGGGDYYDRDVTATYDRKKTGRSYSQVAEKLTARVNPDYALAPLNRTIRSMVKSPVVWAFDETGSMGTLPKVLVDKAAMVVGEVARNRYLDDSEFCIAAIGDVEPYGNERAPLQVGEFCKPKSLDEWFQRVYLEGNGGGQGKESYELMAQFMATRCQMPNATTPICLFTGDEGFRETIPTNTLNEWFGGSNEPTTAKQAFAKLIENFKGNVVLVRRRYSGLQDESIYRQWAKALGEGRIVKLETDIAIGDLVVGTIALLSGSRTLAEYVEDVKNRPLTLGNTKFEAQSPERIAEIERALTALDGYCENKFEGNRGRGSKYDLTPKEDGVLPKVKGKKKTSKAEDQDTVNEDEGVGKKGKTKPGRLY